MKRRQDAAGWRAVTVTIGALGVLLASGAAQRALAASSTDYPGPCSGEATAPGTPLYLAADFITRRTRFGFITMPDVGRLRLGISCVETKFFVLRWGPGSTLCRDFGFCQESDFGAMQMKEEFAFAVRHTAPSEVPFFHDCDKHGFGWYDAMFVAPGPYLAFAQSGSTFIGNGHGTMDTYAFFGNGGQYQPVNCAPPGGGGGGGGGGDDPGGGGPLILE